MRVTVLELPARYGSPGVALDEVRSALTLGPAADLVLLPEASLTGYVSPRLDFDLSRFAEPLDGDTAQALRSLAMAHRTHLVGPLIELDEGHRYNAMVGFGPDGLRFLHYRKRHPWMPEQWATPGPLPWPRARVGGLKLTCAVCFDVHFLEEEMVDELHWADVLLFSSAWVQDGPEDSRTPKLQSLARFFGVTIVNANWGPGDPAVPGQGGSCVVRPDGTVQAIAPGAARLDVEVSGRSSR